MQSQDGFYDGGSAAGEWGSADDAEQTRRPAIDPNADLVQFYFRDIRPISSLLDFSSPGNDLSGCGEEWFSGRHLTS